MDFQEKILVFGVGGGEHSFVFVFFFLVLNFTNFYTVSLIFFCSFFI